MNKPLRVLIVEDSVDDTLLLVLELQHGGYAPTYERVETADAMAAMLTNQVWDIVLSDFTMPNFSGQEALEVLKITGLDVPFIIVSGSIGEETAVASMKGGANDYLLKSSLKRLVPAIQRELGEAEFRRQRRQAQHDLNERAKELKCLYGIAMITERPAVTSDEVCQEAVNLIPTGWQHPDITCARIITDGKEFKTPNYNETVWKQASDIIIDGQRIGAIEVCYLEEKPECDEGPFLKEQRNLINGITSQLGSFIQRKRAEETEEHLYLMLRTIRNVNQLIVKEKNRDKLLKSICNNFIKTRGCSAAWIALLDESGRLITVAESGGGKDFLPMVRWLKQGKLPNCGQRALRQSAVVITEESALTCNDCPLAKGGSSRGAMTIRLEHDGKVYGFLSANIPVEFLAEPEEHSLFEEVAGDIAFALHGMELEQQHKQAEEAMRKREAILNESQRIGHIGSWELDIVSNTLSWSDETYRLFDLEPQQFEATYEAFLDNIHPDDREMVDKAYTESLNNKAPYDIVHRLLLKDGTVKYVNESCESFFDDDGKPIRSHGIVQDITERRQAEQALRNSEERLNTIFEYAPDAYYLSSLDGTFTDGNKAAEELTGYSKQELIGKSFMKLDLLPASEILKSAQTLSQNTDGQSTGPDEITLNRKDGSQVQVEVSTHPVEIQGQTYVLGNVRDITERKRAEEEIKELEQKAHLASHLASVGEMAAGIAHEINNPLTGVIGFSQLLMKKDIPKDIEEDIVTINEGAQRVASIVKRLLSFARQQKLERRYVNINDVLHVTLDMRKYQMETGNITVVNQLDPELPWTMADAGQLQQVFLNLIMNAESAMRSAHDKGKLLIKAEKVADKIRLSVTDDGPGITRDNIDKVFNPFFTTKKEGEGTGLGLSVCHGILADHGGRIYVESKSGKGATFIVELPIVTEEKAAVIEPVATETQKAASARILVVDDEPAVRELLSKVLTGEGHQVETVDNADDALKMVEGARYNLILLDIRMPGMSGIELYKRLTKAIPSLAGRIIFSTGDVMAADTREFLSRTKAHRIAKPFDINQLKQEINLILAKGKG